MTKQDYIKFYKQARFNNDYWSKTAKGYEKDRMCAFVDWCDFTLEELDELSDRDFNATEFRNKFGQFEFPPEYN